MCKVSVLMPVYNAAKYLKEAIDSIVNQAYEDWELIVVDDGSTDESVEIIQSYTDTRIRFYQNGENRGIVYTRNRMIAEARGEYIAFLDSDDISMPDRLKHQIDFLDSHSEYAMCGTWALMIDQEGRQLKKINMATRDEDIKCSLFFANTFVQSSVMIRKQILFDNPYDPDFPVAEDYELWCRLSQKYKLRNIPVQLTRYRWHGDNISVDKKVRMDSLIDKIYKTQLMRLGIDVSDEDLILHTGIKDKNRYNIQPKAYIKMLKEWLRKLAAANTNIAGLNRASWKAMIAFRWMYACKEWGVRSKMFLPPRHLAPQSWKVLTRLLYERL